MEFALVIPVLAVLLLGTFTGGMVLNQKQQITHAAREGARYASSIAADQTFVSGTWAENVRDLVVERSVGELDAAAVCVSLVHGNPASVIAPAAAHSTLPGGTPCIPGQTYPVTANDDGLRVQVTASRPATIELGPLGGVTVNVRASATAKAETPL